MFRSTYRQVLAKRDGIEVSIPNIIVAIVVSLVVIAAVVAGVVFVIPFSQNASAQGDAQTVQSSEQLYYAQASPAVFGTGKQMVDSKAVLENSKNVSVVVSSDGSGYCVGSHSATGNTYYVVNTSTDIKTVLNGGALTAALTAAGCLTPAQVKTSTDLDGS
jgi:hypothetical protein